MPMYIIFILFHVNYIFLLYIWMYFCITALWTILSLMPATSYPKAIGGVC